MMKHLLLLLLLLPASSRSQTIVGYYYGNYEKYPHNLIDYSSITHIAHAFLIPDSLGNLKYDDWFLYPELVKAAHDHGKKIVVSLGGWGNSGAFKYIVKDLEIRTKFINNLVKFIKENNYDGADIDWEFPSREEKYSYLYLIRVLRNTFDDNDIEILSAAIPAVDWSGIFEDEHSVNLSGPIQDPNFYFGKMFVHEFQKHLNWVGIMTYDFYGPWEKRTGHNTALCSGKEQEISVDFSIRHYLDKGFDPEKLCAGMEFVGYKFNSPGLYKPHKGGVSISYKDAQDLIPKGYKHFWDEQTKTPYLFNKDSLHFITIDDANSIRYKSEYIAEKELAGVIIWKLGLDYRNGKHELLQEVKNILMPDITDKPQLLLPEDNIIYHSQNYASAGEYERLLTNFKWDNVPGAKRYQLQACTNPEFNWFVRSFITKENSFSTNEFQNSGKYYWRVRAENNGCYGDWSETRNFTRLSSDFMVFEKNTDKKLTIKYTVAAPQLVSFRLYDMYGRLIKSVIDEFKLPGTYENSAIIPAMDRCYFRTYFNNTLAWIRNEEKPWGIEFKKFRVEF